MTKKFDITGRHTVQTAKMTSDIDEDMEHFIAGAESLTTMTVQIPERLKRALKRLALDRRDSMPDRLGDSLRCGSVFVHHVESVAGRIGQP